ncbi:CLP1_P domain-containing protein [Meloidogyne graminicola]|uniref:CLP1_P domain-containing protein n=1 Tax=Meloidogyne graminicola TaxID=189291 RepID=A0A8T0A0I0_9BILA|nr:CLP1_P domain-containing protein [Meloidogyne graminicola]
MVFFLFKFYMDILMLMVIYFLPKKFNSSNYTKIATPSGYLPAIFSINDTLSTELHFERIYSRLREFVNEPKKTVEFIEKYKPIAIVLVKTKMDNASKFIHQQMINCSDYLNIFPQFGIQLGMNLCYLNDQMRSSDAEGLANLEKDYYSICDRIYSYIESNKKCITFICGNKGVGKSSTARFLINALNSGSLLQPPKPTCRVFLLDTDIGQSELCPAGCISLCEIKRPLIGVPFTSQLATLPKSYFFGSNSPAVSTDFYIKLIGYLIDYFNKMTKDNKDDNFVLIVNSLGWITDLGYDLMLRVLNTVKPTFLVNLESNEFLNFTVPSIYPRFTITTRKRESLIYLDSKLPTSAQLRNFQMAGYLAQLFPQTERTLNLFFKKELRLAELPAYRVRFCSVSIYIHQELRHVDDKLMLCALNCSFIALCKIEEGFEKNFIKKYILNDSSLPSRLELCSDLDESKDENEETIKNEDIIPIERNIQPMLKCIGFGLIRAINPQKKLFYVLTPVEQKILHQVNVFALGHCLNTPDMLLFDSNVNVTAPYVVELDSTLQAHHKKFFDALRSEIITNNANRPC